MAGQCDGKVGRLLLSPFSSVFFFFLKKSGLFIIFPLQTVSPNNHFLPDSSECFRDNVVSITAARWSQIGIKTDEEDTKMHYYYDFMVNL